MARHSTTDSTARHPRAPSRPLRRSEMRRFEMPRRAAVAALGWMSLSWMSLGWMGCSTGPQPAKYPDLKLNVISLELTIDDPRKRLYDTVTESSDVTELGEERYSQQLPSTFEQAAVQRLAKISSGDGPNLKVIATVRQADVTFRNELRGNFARFDVRLSFKVTTQSGALLDKGRGVAWQELPEREMNAESLAGTYRATALAAFDQYFADEEILRTINSQLARYQAAKQP